MANLDDYEAMPDALRMNAGNLSSYMTAFSVARAQEANSIAWTSIMHHRLIQHEHSLAKTVLDMENTLCQEIFARGTFLRSPADWIETLLRDIHAKLVLKQPMVFVSRSYLDNPGVPAMVYTEPKWAVKERMRLRNRPSERQVLQAVAIYLGRILREWFNLPSSFLLRGRAQFVDVLLNKFGPGILYLELVWEFHSTLPRFLFRNPPRDYHSNQLNKDRPYDLNAMDDFVKAIQAIPPQVVADVELLSEDFDSFIRMAQAYSQQINDEAGHHTSKQNTSIRRVSCI